MIYLLTSFCNILLCRHIYISKLILDCFRQFTFVSRRDAPFITFTNVNERFEVLVYVRIFVFILFMARVARGWCV